MRPRSRLLRHQAKQSSKQAIWYLLLSVVFVVLVIKFGVPGFIQLVSWWTGKDAGKQTTDIDVPPQAPVLDNLPEATYSAQIKVSGLGQPGMDIRLEVNDSPTDETTVNTDGRFVFEKVTLIEGENRLSLFSINDKNKESVPTSAVIVLDKKLPVITITEPSNESVILGLKNQSLTIKGKVDSKDTDLKINDNFVSVNIDGGFEYRTQLKEGENIFRIVAVDLAGNVSEQELKVTFSL